MRLWFFPSETSQEVDVTGRYPAFALSEIQAMSSRYDQVFGDQGTRAMSLAGNRPLDLSNSTPRVNARISEGAVIGGFFRASRVSQTLQTERRGCQHKEAFTDSGAVTAFS